MTNTIDQYLIDDAKAAGFYVSSGFVMSSHNGHFTKEIEKFAQLQRERQPQPTPSQSVDDKPRAYECIYQNDNVVLVYEEEELDPDDVERWGSYELKPLYTKPQATSQYSKYALAWQPIATAPKDKRILVFTGQEIYAANWVKNIENDQEAWRAGYMTNGDGLVVSALLWHDAPDAP